MAFGGYYNGKRVFLTGHTGFKGAWLALWLKQLGAQVMGYAQEPPFSPSLHRKGVLAQTITDIDGDVRDYDKLRRAIDDFKPHAIFHLAAQSLVRKSYDEPRETFETNLMGLVNLLEAARGCGSLQSLVFVSSDKCYENREWLWAYRENDPFGGHDPYSASKGAGEIVFSSYARSFFNTKENFAAASARAGNVIGGGDFSENRLVPDCIRALEGGRTIPIRNPQSTRPWQFVLEPLSGYLLLGEKLATSGNEFGGGWNFAPSGKPSPVGMIAGMIVKAWESGSWEDLSSGEKFAPHEARSLHLSSEKAEAMLGWEAVLDIDEAVRFTVEGYRNFHNLSGEELRAAFTQQIDRYRSLAAERGQAWAEENGQ